MNYSVISESTIPKAFGNESFIFRWGGGQNFLVIYCGRIGGWVARGSKINNPWNREGGEGHIFRNSYCVCVCVGGGGIRILPLVFMFQKCLSFWGPSPLKCLLLFPFSILFFMKFKTKKQKKKKREREIEEKVHFWPLLIQLKDIFH